MFSIDNFIQNIWQTVTGFHFLLLVFIAAFIFKIIIMVRLVFHKRSSRKTNKQIVLLLIAIAVAIVINFTWIIKTAHKTFWSTLDNRILLFLIRVTWAAITLHYHALALFIESLVKKKNLLKNVRQKILMPISGVLFLFFTVLAFVKFNDLVRPTVELTVVRYAPYYYLFALLLISLVVSLAKLKSSDIPRILKRQFTIFVKVLFFPIIATEIIHFYPIKSLYVGRRYTITAISISLLTYALYHCIKKIIGLRFLNIKNHVQSKNKLYFIHNFKNILEKFSNISNTRELVHITKSFFKDTLHIPMQKTHLYIKKEKKQTYQEENMQLLDQDESTVETFLSAQDQDSQIQKILIHEKIVINDELAFSNFYEEEKNRKKIISFLNHLSADIFIPIYEKHKLIAYIIIERFARLGTGNKHHEFYSDIERDQMIVFANHLGKIINVIKHKSIDEIIRQDKALKDTLYTKEKEIAGYKESIRSFLKNDKEKKIGIISYKNRMFTPINQTAQSFISINLNTHSGHPISKAIKKIANQVIEYKSPQTCFIKNILGEKLVVSGIPNVEKNNVIITVRYPEISDFLKDKISMLKDPTLWEYLLYLETTEYGKLINTFIPGDGETLLNFKVDLLRASLSKQPVLLHAPEKDIMSIVEILHHISQREFLEVVDVKKQYKNLKLPIKLFGVNPTLGLHSETLPLFKKLDKTGTLCIKNIHLLDTETQEHLQEYITYGTYRAFKGYNKETSNVRIICSTPTNLNAAMQDGHFSQSLCNELNKSSITLKPLEQFHPEEIIHLATEIAKQAITTDEFHHILEFTDAEKNRLISSRPSSIHELKSKVKLMLIKKSQRNSIYHETQFDPAYNITDPEIIEAARLGKHALRDPKIMSMLWNKFKSQNKIAHLLGVNRSSVNRRCKEYNLI